MTASLDSQIFEPVSRDRLFFDQFRYCMSFRFRESGRMRTLDHDHIRHSCHYANMLWRNQSARLEVIDPNYQQRMLELCDLINSITVPHKRVVYHSHQYFYTNHPEIFNLFTNFDGISHCNYSQAVIDRPRDVVILNQSEHQWRTYFRDRYYEPHQIQQLSKFLLNRPQQFRLTANWQSRLNKRHVYITASFFVDHHDQQDTLLLNMVLPGCVRKTLPICVSDK